MKTSTTIGKLAEALAKAQGQIKGALKDSKNPFFHSTYADLESVWGACREPLSSNGLSVVQGAGEVAVEGKVSVETLLTHISGEFISSTFSATPEKQTPQGIGSCITYLRRYGLQSIVGIAPSDDDGEAAEGRGNVNAETKKPEGKVAPPKPTKKQQETLDAIFDKLCESVTEGKVVDKAKVGAVIFSLKGKYPEKIENAGTIAAFLISQNKMNEMCKDVDNADIPS
jgi:hypothetical protein